MSWRTACPDWRDRIATGRSLVPDLPLFEDEAAKAVRIFNRLRIPDVPGKPTLGEAAGDWFRDIVRAIFGAYDSETGERHIQEVFLLVPKKNAKTTGAAAVMVTASIVNRRPEAELLLIAPTKEIADISFRQASGMIRSDPDLDRLFQLQRHIRTITHRVSGAQIKIIAADTDAVTGAKATYILVDETHVFAEKPRAKDVFVELRGALAARPDGFLFQITTQSKTPPAGVFRAELTSARAVRDGEQELPLLPVLYELPENLAADGGWKRPEHFGLVNPNLGRSVRVQFLERELAKAEREGREALALFASQHLNVEIGLALRSDRWVGADHWPDAVDDTLNFNTLLERSEAILVGIDGGGLDDLLGVTLLGRERGTRRWLSWSRAWMHAGVLELRKSEAARFRDFERDGDLIIVEDLAEANDQLAQMVLQIHEAGLLAQVGLDLYGPTDAADALAQAEIPQDLMVGVQQGWKLNGAIKTAEVRLSNRTLVVAQQPLMMWCVGNAKAEAKGNAVTITKQVSGTGKIDPLIALFVAAVLMVRNPEAQSVPSVVAL